MRQVAHKTSSELVRLRQSEAGRLPNQTGQLVSVPKQFSPLLVVVHFPPLRGTQRLILPPSTSMAQLTDAHSCLDVLPVSRANTKGTTVILAFDDSIEFEAAFRTVKLSKYYENFCEQQKNTNSKILIQ